MWQHDGQLELLETQGFDLLAQVEAMLRSAREYQRDVQRLRGIVGKGQTSTSHLPALRAVRKHIGALRATCAQFTETLGGIDRTAAAIRPAGNPHAR